MAEEDPTLVDEQRVMARVTRRFVPLAFICYVVAYLDRVNVGFAAGELQRDLGLSATAYGVAAGLFFLGYCVCEVPSNIILERIGARRWIARIMITWGLVAMATMFVRDARTFMIARVLLGVAEAGFFPGIVLFFTYWFPASERARTGAWFMTASPIAVIVGAPLSTWIMRLDGASGLHGWQWLFLIEGVPAVILGVVVLATLTDRPEQARWLAPEERAWLARRMAGDRAAREGTDRAAAVDFRHPALWLLCAVFFLNSIVNYGMFLWLPKLLADVTHMKGFALSLTTAVPFAAALAAMVVVARISDRSGERRRVVAACALVTGVGLVVAVLFQRQTLLLVAGFAIAQMALRSLAGVFWALPPERLGPRAAAVGIGLINAVGGVGGFIGPALIGVLLDATGGYAGGLLALTGVLLAEALVALQI
ncbi:MAG TPA: MFS transporter [Vicinamibacterales bacterium]|jgi:ACS family tartrate transporter-like MFS transporter